MKGQDVVYKDVIEPLESVSVSLTSTDKKDITEYGSPLEVSPYFLISDDWQKKRFSWQNRGKRRPPSPHQVLLQIAATLTREVLTPSNQSVKVLGVNEVRVL